MLGSSTNFAYYISSRSQSFIGSRWLAFFFFFEHRNDSFDQGKIVCEPPNNRLYKFVGNMQFNSVSDATLTQS